MKLIVAEKPNVANSIAKALKITSKEKGYYKSSEYYISWSFGHLIGLAMPAAYDPNLKKWSAESLPFIPNSFKLQLSPDQGHQVQFHILKRLIFDSHEIYCATDNDREGDLIFHYIYTHAGANKPYYRILPNSTTPAGILKALEKPIPQRDNVIYAAQSRSESDYLIGLNGTRALSIAAGRKISIGRVQTPTLAIICKRYLDHINFKPTTYYPVVIELSADKIQFIARLENPCESKTAAEQVLTKLSDMAICTLSEQKKVSENPPLPYFLSSLQQDANTTLGFTLQKTLDLAQDLYEKYHITTYPRTDSAYLTSDLYNEVRSRIEGLYQLNFVSNTQSVALDNLPKRCINDSKAPNHHAIIPTDDLSKYDELPQDHKALFQLIALRFIAAFSEPCIKSKTKYIFSNNDHQFVSHGSTVVKKGWRSILTEKDGQDEENQVLPQVDEGQQLPIVNSSFETKQTKPQPILTDTTLSKLMKAAGRDIDDPTLKAAMEKNDLRDGGLGTEATRAGIVESLVNVQLIQREGKKIIPTTMGLSLYELVKDNDIAQPILTAKWEEQLSLMAEGKIERQPFMSAISEYTTKLTKQLLEIGGRLDTDPIKLSCPKCSTGMIKEYKKSYGCSNYNNETNPCDFGIWKTILNKKITHLLLREIILEKGTKNTIKGFKTEKGSFDARLVLNEDFKLKFSMDAVNSKGEELKCPSCKSGIRINEHGAFCQSCDFKAWRKIAGKSLTDAILISLCSSGKTQKIKGFVNSKNKTFDASLKLNTDHKVEFCFDKPKPKKRSRFKAKH